MRQMKIDKLFTTLEESKKWLEENRTEGCICPCCNQFAKIYKRKLNAGMALFLIGLYKLSKKSTSTNFSNKSIMSEMKINTSSLDYSILKHFNLIKESGIIPNEKRKSGFWKLTSLGNDFVEKKVQVNSHVYLYDSEVLGFSESKISIMETLGEKFDYNELMK